MSNYLPQAQKLLPVLRKHQRLNWKADHVNATYGLNMKTRLRYGQTPSHLYYTAQPRSPCGRTASLALTAIKAIVNNTTIPCEPNTANRHEESNIFLEIHPCTNNMCIIGLKLLEHFGAFLL